MEKKADEKLITYKPPQEPIHPVTIKYREDVREIYRVLKAKYQEKINAAFDRAARQIGFVVASTLPCRIEVADGKVKTVSLNAVNLKETIFERELMPVLKSFNDEKLSTISDGSYDIYLLWTSALMVILEYYWMEPAQFLKNYLGSLISPTTNYQTPSAATMPQIVAEATEPAHWFEPGVKISSNEAILLSVIDEVYPELHLSERIAKIKTKIVKVGSEVKEPAHSKIQSKVLPSDEVLRQIKKLISQQEGPNQESEL